MPEGAKLCLPGGLQGSRRCGIWPGLGQTCALLHPGHPYPVLCTRRGSACMGQQPGAAGPGEQEGALARASPGMLWTVGGGALLSRAGCKGLGDEHVSFPLQKKKSGLFPCFSRPSDEVAVPGPGVTAGLGVLDVDTASIAFEDKGMLVFYCPLSSSEAPSRARRREGKDSFPYDGGLVIAAWPASEGLQGSLLHHASCEPRSSEEGAVPHPALFPPLLCFPPGCLFPSHPAPVLSWGCAPPWLSHRKTWSTLSFSR